MEILALLQAELYIARLYPQAAQSSTAVVASRGDRRYGSGLPCTEYTLSFLYSVLSYQKHFPADLHAAIL